MKQKKLIFNLVVNRNWKKLTDSRKRAKILADNRKSYHPIETLLVLHTYIHEDEGNLKKCYHERQKIENVRSNVSPFHYLS